ncbi:MAG TPA: GNAT family N-acetyltransferase [Rhizomicrobium sp.]|jgi:N-acetylglutamate synthase-like GNAT family acetyltransferase|nr:GNAT family N-acetyltransferase [Rhizomicrobium sp.]
MMTIRLKTAADDARLMPLWTGHFGSSVVVSRGRVHDARDLDGFVAEEGGVLLGAATFAPGGSGMEIVTLDSVVEDRGAGAALLEAVTERAREAGMRRLWLVTTNDNIRAIRFYQKRGWDLCALHRDAVAQARKLKPKIPLLGNDGIPILHEIEFERLL